MPTQDMDIMKYKIIYYYYFLGELICAHSFSGFLKFFSNFMIFMFNLLGLMFQFVLLHVTAYDLENNSHLAVISNLIKNSFLTV